MTLLLNCPGVLSGQRDSSVRGRLAVAVKNRRTSRSRRQVTEAGHDTYAGSRLQVSTRGQ